MLDIFQTLFRYKEKESPDELGFYPGKVHVDAFPERRYLWTSHLLVILSALSISFNMILAASIYLLLPMIRVKPRFFRINNYFNQIELIQPREIRYPVSDLVTEQYIQNYILLRYTMTDDYTDNEDRWKEESAIYWMSVPAVYSEFWNEEAEKSLDQFKKKGLQRFVDIEWVKFLSRGLWQVQFKRMDYLPNASEPEVSYWRATLRIKYADLHFPSEEDRVLNPFGFLVTNYSLSYHGSQPDR
jgi:type IV secretory pathway component VirB8